MASSSENKKVLISGFARRPNQWNIFQEEHPGMRKEDCKKLYEEEKIAGNNISKSSGEKPTKIKIRCKLDKFRAILGKLKEPHKKVIETTPLASLLELQTEGFGLLKDVIKSIACNFDYENMMLKVNDGGETRNILIKSEDFSKIMGIKNGSGTTAPQNPELDDDLIGKFCNLNKDGKYKNICEYKVKDALEKAPENDEITIKQAFVLIALHYIVCPTAGGRLGKNWLWYVRDVGSLNTQPWVTIAMNTLKEGIKNYQTGKGAERNIGGCVLFLQLYCMKMRGLKVMEGLKGSAFDNKVIKGFQNKWMLDQAPPTRGKVVENICKVMKNMTRLIKKKKETISPELLLQISSSLENHGAVGGYKNRAGQRIVEFFPHIVEDVEEIAMPESSHSGSESSSEKHIDGDEHDDGDQGGDVDVQTNVEFPLPMSADAATPTEKYIDGDEHNDADQGGDADVQINVESPLQMSADAATLTEKELRKMDKEDLISYIMIRDLKFVDQQSELNHGRSLVQVQPIYFSGHDSDATKKGEKELQAPNIEVFNVAGDGGHGDFDVDENDLKVAVILKSSLEEAVSIKAKEFEEFGRQYGGVEENDIQSETVFVNEPRIEEIIEEDMPRNDDVLRRYAESGYEKDSQSQIVELLVYSRKRKLAAANDGESSKKLKSGQQTVLEVDQDAGVNQDIEDNAPLMPNIDCIDDVKLQHLHYLSKLLPPLLRQIHKEQEEEIGVEADALACQGPNC